MASKKQTSLHRNIHKIKNEEGEGEMHIEEYLDIYKFYIL